MRALLAVWLLNIWVTVASAQPAPSTSCPQTEAEALLQLRTVDDPGMRACLVSIRARINQGLCRIVGRPNTTPDSTSGPYRAFGGGYPAIGEGGTLLECRGPTEVGYSDGVFAVAVTQNNGFVLFEVTGSYHTSPGGADHTSRRVYLFDEHLNLLAFSDRLAATDGDERSERWASRFVITGPGRVRIGRRTLVLRDGALVPAS